VKTVATATLAVKLEVRMSKKLAMPKDATLSKEMMKIVRMRLMGLKMRSPPKVEVKPKMAPSRFSKGGRQPREVTPFRDEPAPASVVPLRPTTPGPDRQGSPVDPALTQRPVTPAPPEWSSYDAPINFTWVIPDELCGMGWPKSRDQVRFLVDQGIDHLVSLSPEKIPPAYAYPNLKHTMIPVEDFTGPTISEIQKFIEITDEARKEGEAVAVHCAEGRGRTGVMCACYLIYYYDMEPWDAIRIMRRQRPGSVERKVQEETVVRFYTLLADYGKDSVDKLDQREKQLIEMQKRQQAELMRTDALATQQQTQKLLSHMHSFHSNQNGEAKRERVARMRRARSMPKMDDQEVNAMKLKNHLASFLQGEKAKTRPKRTKSQREAYTEGESNECSDSDRRSRATTPGRALLEEVSLRPASERNLKNRLDPPPSQDSKCEFKNHFHSFMKTPATVKRGRSFSQPRGKEDAGSGREEGTLSRGESFKQQELSPQQQERLELENHTKRFLQRKSLMRPIKHSDESGDDSLSLSVTQSSSAKADKEREDSCSCSEDELESCPVSAVVSSKPPLSKPLAETNGAYNGLRPVERRRRPVESDLIGAEEDARLVVSARRFERRQRSKSDITGLVSAGIALEEEKEEERKEEERREEERKREERRKEEKKQEERRQEERRQEERRQEERRQEERRQEERRQEEKRQEEKRKEERRERDRLLRAVHEPAPLNNPVTETVRSAAGENRQEGISSNSGRSWLTEEERVRKGSVYSSGEFQPVSMGSSSNNYVRVANSAPKPFNLSRQLSRDLDENGTSTLTTTATITLGRPQEANQSQGGSETSSSTSWGIPGAKLLSPPPQEKKEKERSPKFFGDNNKENRKSQSKEVRTRGEQRRAEQQKEGEVAQVEVEVETSRRDSGTTSDILAACKSGLRRLTYRKTYTRTRSHPLEEGQEDESKQSTKSVAQSPERGDVASTERATRYTTGSSGSRIPNRPTTPGPYFGVDRPKTPGPYRPFSPTPGASITSPSLGRESWKRTNQKFNYSRYKYGTHETFV